MVLLSSLFLSSSKGLYELLPSDFVVCPLCLLFVVALKNEGLLACGVDGVVPPKMLQNSGVKRQLVQQN